MGKYRKKPVVIDAVLFDWTQEMLDALKGQGMDTITVAKNGDGVVTILRIKTLEGTMRVAEGDYIIKGIKGEFYPCKPDIFELTYEAVDTPPQ